MSARKYSAPRYGSKRFLPHSRTKKARGHISFHPKNDISKPVHLTSFLAYKAGCTHVIREISKPKSPLHQREISEMVTVLEAPDMVCVGYVLYKDTPVGVKAIYTEHVDNVSDSYMRAVEPKLGRHANMPKAFSNKENKKDKKDYNGDSYDFIRVILHTVPPSSVDRKKAHVIESQINGGSDNNEKLEYAKNLLGKNVPISAFTVKNEAVDISGVTKGKGFQGVIKRFGVRALRKKARKGSRRVGCIGPWHPSNVSYAVARAGQMGKNHRTDLNKQVMLIGKPEKEAAQGNASTPYDPTNKHITPLGGFKNYGEVKGDFIIVKGSVTGPAKGCVALRKSVNDPYKGEMTQEARVKFIDTASKTGKGRFQTSKEKNEFFGYKNVAEARE
eukprot:GAHX01000265.1.p1 GENE.GAHX01000265.1~~GAHX01000265.1.p1  ORF type:complete len:400 (-),score=82.75 GAHX01000265.1:36-1199(-)